ncbi:glycosyltransferase family 4 protein [Litorivicinus sp.]|nr:glycosyltransferase family 4 protein [Litorivicinus sp.]
MQKRLALVGSPGSAFLNFRLSFIRLLVKRGVKVICVAPQFSDSEEQILRDSGAEVFNLGFARMSISIFEFGRVVFRLVKLFRSKNISHCVSFFHKPNILCGFACIICKGVKFVPIIEGLGTLFGKNKMLRFWLLRKLLIIGYRITLITAKRVVFLNQFDRTYFVERSIAPVERCELLGPIGVDLKKFNASGAEVENIGFVFAGRLLVSKGILIFQDAVNHLEALGRLSNVEIMVAGEIDENFDSISADQLNDIKSNKNISYLGHCSLSGVLRKGRILVLPTWYREGVPMVLQEAMASGLPVICTDWPGCRDITIDGYNGLLIPPQDSKALAKAMIFFLDDCTKVFEFGTNARLYAEQNLGSADKNDLLYNFVESS